MKAVLFVQDLYRDYYTALFNGGATDAHLHRMKAEADCANIGWLLGLDPAECIGMRPLA